jgi:dipeptidyl aminopeptidase/acylaminoacyl peptidase
METYNSCPLIPRETLFGNPERTKPGISPDGKYLSYIAPVDGVLNVWVGPLDGDLHQAKPITNDTVRGVRLYFWSKNSREILYLQDIGGDENWRLYGVRIETKEVRDLTPFENVQVHVLDVSKHFPDTVIVAINKDDPAKHDVYRLNLVTGDLERILENPGNQIGWGIDPKQKVRAATVMLPDGGQQVLVRDPDVDNPEWSELVSWAPVDALTSGLHGFNRDSTAVYLIDSAGVNAGRLVKRSLIDNSTEVILEDPAYDVAGIIHHPDTFEIQAAAITRDVTEWTFFDEEYGSDFKYISATIAGELSPAGRDSEDRLWLIGSSSDRRSTHYYLFERSTKALRFLFATRPEIDAFTLAPMEPISFQTRDGLTVHGYLSVPECVEKANLPLVLDVHGGPWARDGWGLNPESQWLANRGYAVLQVNYRGSTGYGKEFLNAGNKEWAGKMHDDLVDAVRWAVDSGLADKKRVAIYGGSYGGFAALVGATFTPDLFCCAVDLVGPSNLITFIKSVPPYWTPMISILTERVGNPDSEEEFLKSRSPLFKVDQIKIPVFIAQGANDPRVKQAESEQIVAALAAKKLDHEYMLFADEGHGFARPENRLKFYAAVEYFFARHLGGRVEEDMK